MDNNMELYNKGRAVPPTAQKTIGAGRLKGMTDINPMWRIQVLTEMFGACGVGWTYEIAEKAIHDGADGEKIATVDINLYFKQDGEWSKPIPGTGGSKLVAKEKSGMFNSDEAFKMALTDAISVACKALGIGADIYWAAGRTKYTGNPQAGDKNTPPAKGKDTPPAGSDNPPTGNDNPPTKSELESNFNKAIQHYASAKSITNKEALAKLCEIIKKPVEEMKDSDLIAGIKWVKLQIGA